MSEDKTLLICYNRGCGKKYSPNDNEEDACQHHPGYPVFHDAYKGWSCCNKKCTDFTEFLSIKGCTKSQHSNVKPPEPPKPVVDKSKADEVLEIKPLAKTESMKRPLFDSPQVTVKPNISPTLLEQIKGLTIVAETKEDETIIAIGQSCKHNSCKGTYTGPASDKEICVYHAGVPIFHEGLKYWSCCQKKTADFAVFLEQPGCSEGNHLWVQKGESKKVKCRMDWHQTGTHVIVSIYAKKYNPDSSCIKLNPIRLTVALYFPEDNSRYNLDIELRGIVDVEESSVNMLPTKTEIKLRKKEPGSWAKLDFPREKTVEESKKSGIDDNIASQVDAVDLSDI